MQILIDKNKKNCKIPLPMVNAGKFRWKTSNPVSNGLDLGVSMIKCSITNEFYLEWQIGYDLEVKKADKEDKEAKDKDTSLKEFKFTSLNGEEKYPYEIAEILKDGIEAGVIDANELQTLYDEIKNNTELIEDNFRCVICNTGSITVNGLKVEYTPVQLPGFTYRFTNSNTKIRINIEKQGKALGYQAMLYFCIPITDFDDYEQYIGRTANSGEIGYWTLSEENQEQILTAFRIFGQLSEKHKHDILEIIKIVQEYAKKENLI